MVIALPINHSYPDHLGRLFRSLSHWMAVEENIMGAWGLVASCVERNYEHREIQTEGGLISRIPPVSWPSLSEIKILLMGITRGLPSCRTRLLVLVQAIKVSDNILAKCLSTYGLPSVTIGLGPLRWRRRCDVMRGCGWAGNKWWGHPDLWSVIIFEWEWLHGRSVV